jgi:hypothetical protein
VPGKGKGALGRGWWQVTPIEIARSLFSLALALIPHEEAKLLLDDEARKRANAAADLAEMVKFGLKP